VLRRSGQKRIRSGLRACIPKSCSSIHIDDAQIHEFPALRTVGVGDTEIGDPVVVEIEFGDLANADQSMSGRVNNFGLGRLSQHAYSSRTGGQGVSIEPFVQRLGKLRGCSGGSFHGSFKRTSDHDAAPDASQSL